MSGLMAVGPCPECGEARGATVDTPVLLADARSGEQFWDELPITHWACGHTGLPALTAGILAQLRKAGEPPLGSSVAVQTETGSRYAVWTDADGSFWLRSAGARVPQRTVVRPCTPAAARRQDR